MNLGSLRKAEKSAIAVALPDRATQDPRTNLGRAGQPVVWCQSRSFSIISSRISCLGEIVSIVSVELGISRKVLIHST